MKRIIVWIMFSLLANVSAYAQGELWGMTNSFNTDIAKVFKTSFNGTGLVTRGSFPIGNPGASPRGSLALGNNGKFYGMTLAGGSFDMGVLFEYDPGTGVYSKKIDFDGANNGASAAGSLVMGVNGKFYGMTSNGGQNNSGVLFEYDPATNTYTKKYDFGGSNGSNPQGNLLLAANGKLYGLTQQGGLGVGVLFEYDPTLGLYSKKFDFDATNGSFPSGSLQLGPNGKLYGTAGGGGSSNSGVLFEFDPATSVFTKKIDFVLDANGKFPVGSLAVANSGKFYGMTANGGSSGYGVIFEYNPATNSYIKKLDFTGLANGSFPIGSLTLAANGKLYGMTRQGGASNEGVLFEYDPVTNIQSKKFDFGGVQGLEPFGSLSIAGNGKLYGMTLGGGAGGAGVIFEFDPATSTYMRKIDLNSQPNGSNPMGGLTLSSNGKFYGMMPNGGSSAMGILFEYDSSTRSITNRVVFEGAANGSYPQGSLLEGENGKLYGLTSLGGVNDLGVLFEYDPATGTFTKKIEFDGSSKGSGPYGNLVRGNDGKFYGLTRSGGSLDFGVLFVYDPLTATYSKKIDFDMNNGARPEGSLALGGNGKLYGMTSQGGTIGAGVLFEYDPVVNVLTEKVDFDGFENGSQPTGSLTLNGNGKFYGMTYKGGTLGFGMLFEYDPASASFLVKVNFDEINGRAPHGSLVQNGNGKLYGMTSQGGANGSGVLFEYDPVTSNYTKKIDFDYLVSGSNPYGNLLFVKANQTIQFGALPAKTMGDAGFALTAAASSGLVVTIGTSSDKIAITGNQVTLVKPGRAIVTVTQSGNESFNSAPSIQQSFCINPSKPAITLSTTNPELPILTSNAASGNQWFWNGTAINGAIGATYVVSKAGIYKAQVKVDDCVSEFSSDQILVVTGDIVKKVEPRVEIYPNPVSDWLTVSLGAIPGEKIVTIFQMNGVRKESHVVLGNEIKLLVADYSAGLYLVNVKTENATKTVRFIKQ